MTVFDVGANVGLFSVYLLTNFKNMNIRCFEPIPQLYRIAKMNLERFVEAGKGKFEIFNMGLSNENVDEIEFTFDPHMTVASSLFESQMEEDTKMEGKVSDIPKLCRAVISDLGTFQLLPNWFVEFVCAGLELPVIQWFFVFPAICYVIIFAIKRAFKKQKVSCTLKRLSSVLETMQPEMKIDLIKIDVEGAEFDVLKGIDDKHYKLIEQAVVEVHDVGNTRVSQIVDFLRQRGFKNIVVDQEHLELHKIMKIFTVYATKHHQ
eukprot:TRINITY_DN2826_c0_g1_i3.p1 TRINITY_DN2826_c0_g1~~TRINITY_DN2826_c0_g1_i3.p1  ORF type:complete len:263 (-),score=89.12 TRINITY_DN2826_c0_g1_i3:16-804(-)